MCFINWQSQWKSGSWIPVSHDHLTCFRRPTWPRLCWWPLRGTANLRWVTSSTWRNTPPGTSGLISSLTWVGSSSPSLQRYCPACQWSLHVPDTLTFKGLERPWREYTHHYQSVKCLFQYLIYNHLKIHPHLYLRETNPYIRLSVNFDWVTLFWGIQRTNLT